MKPCAWLAPPVSAARSWLCRTFDASFQLDRGGPTWAAAVLREVRLPRWAYDGHDKGAAVFVRVPGKTADGPTEARLHLTPGHPLPEVRLTICIHGRWDADDERSLPPPSLADIYEEAEALLVLLGCRSPRFRLRDTVRLR